MVPWRQRILLTVRQTTRSMKALIRQQKACIRDQCMGSLNLNTACADQLWENREHPTCSLMCCVYIISMNDEFTDRELDFHISPVECLPCFSLHISTSICCQYYAPMDIIKDHPLSHHRDSLLTHTHTENSIWFAWQFSILSLSFCLTITLTLTLTLTCFIVFVFVYVSYASRSYTTVKLF